jgi:hypothetical protein
MKIWAALQLDLYLQPQALPDPQEDFDIGFAPNQSRPPSRGLAR